MPVGPEMSTTRSSPPHASATHCRSAARCPVRPTRDTDHARLRRGCGTGEESTDRSAPVMAPVALSGARPSPGWTGPLAHRARAMCFQSTIAAR